MLEVSLVESFYEKGEINEAESLCETIITMQPNHAPTLHLLGRIMIKRGNADRAIELLRRAIVIDARPIFLEDLADVLVSEFRFSEAVPVYLRAHDSLDKDWKIIQKIADCYISMGNLCEAIESLGQCYTTCVGDDFAAAMGPGLQPPEAIAVKERFDTLFKHSCSLGVCPVKKVNGWFVPRTDLTLVKT